MRILAVLAVLALLFTPAMADESTVEDREGNTAAVSLVTRGEEQFAAVTITNPGKRKDATHLLRRKDISRVFLACKIALKSKREVESNEQVVVDSVVGEEAKLDIVLVKPEKELLRLVRVVEKGRERAYLLDKESYERLAALLRDAKSNL